MKKRAISFLENPDNDFDNGFSDALTLKCTAIQEIEQEKEENSFMEETVTITTSKKKL